jgi:hypothetical protein
LAASPAEIQEAEAAKPADFADPENFATGLTTVDASTESETNNSTSSAATGTSPPEEPKKDSQKAAPPVAAASVNSSPPTAAVTQIHESELNSYLAVGVPLAAAALLMGIYWAILRTGAV